MNSIMHRNAPVGLTGAFVVSEAYGHKSPNPGNSDCKTVFNLCCLLCSAYEHKAFIDGFQYGVRLLLEVCRQD